MAQSSEILNDIKQVLEISSRVDERVKSIQGVQQELTTRMNQIGVEISNLSGRVMVLESKNGGKLREMEGEMDAMSKRIEKIDYIGSYGMKEFNEEVKEENKNIKEKIIDIYNRMQRLETTNEGWEAKTKYYSGLVIQAIWVIIVCYILYKIGINGIPAGG